MKVRRCTALERIQVHDGSRSALGPQGFDMDIPLQLGHVLTNEPGFCKCPCFILPNLCCGWIRHRERIANLLI